MLKKAFRQRLTSFEAKNMCLFLKGVSVLVHYFMVSYDLHLTSVHEKKGRVEEDQLVEYGVALAK